MKNHSQLRLWPVGDPRTDIDQAARRRIAEWVKYYAKRFEEDYPTQTEFAEALGLKGSTVSNILNGHRPAGLEVLLKLRVKFNADAERVLKFDPPWDELKPNPAPVPQPGQAEGRTKRAKS